MCCCCDILHVKSLSMTYTPASSGSSSDLTITIPKVTFTNGQIFELILTSAVPEFTAGDNPVVLVTDTASTYSMYLQMGNYVRGNSLKGVSRLLMVYGSDPAHMSILPPRY